MSKEAMKLALEALKKAQRQCHYYNIAPHLAYEDAIKALEEALAKQEQGEPEMVRNMRMWVTALKSVSDNGQHMKIPSGLSSGTCWELAVALEKFIDTTPQPKREQRSVSEHTGEPVANPEWANNDSRLIVHYLRKYTILDADRVGVMMDFAAECAKRGYTKPQQRTWVGLTDDEIQECAGEYPWTPTGLKCVRAIEAKLKEKNT